MRNTNEKISMKFRKYSVNVQKKKKFIIVFVFLKCVHEKLTNFNGRLNLKYEQKDEEDCNNGGNAQVGQAKTRKETKYSIA